MEIIEKVKKVLEEQTYVDRINDDQYEYEIFSNYDDYLGDRSLAEITRSDHPRETFEELMTEICIDSEDYYYPELIKTLEGNIEEFSEHEDEIRAWISDHVSWYVPVDHYNQDVNVVISLDAGDRNYDFTKCNILNWYGCVSREDGDPIVIPEDSPIRWLAMKQGKVEELQRALQEEVETGTDVYKEHSFATYSPFTKSVIQELQNAGSHMNTLVFLVKMKLFDFFSLQEMVESEKKLNDSYYYNERKGTKSFTLKKNTMCGLYDIWDGGGSVLEIELEKDIEIGTKDIFDIWIDCPGSKCNGRGYDIYDVYGICGDAYKETLVMN